MISGDRNAKVLGLPFHFHAPPSLPSQPPSVKKALKNAK